MSGFRTSFKFFLLGILICFAFVSTACGDQPSADTKNNTAAKATSSAGKVTISYDLNRLAGHGSNQVAVWIEDSSGKYVKSIFATKFTAQGGYKERPNALPAWRKASGWENATQAEINAVSAATQQPGHVSVVWDCTDRNGQPVPSGRYVYKAEGNIVQEQIVLWTGTITVGNAADHSVATAAYSTPEAAQNNPLLLAVSADFQPHN